MTATAYAPRTLAEVEAALSKVPSRVTGDRSHDTFVRLTGGLVQAVIEAGGNLEDAVNLMVAHSPGWTHCAKEVRSLATGGNPASFWAICKEHGYDLKRTGPRREPTPDERRASAKAKAEREALERERGHEMAVKNAIGSAAYDVIQNVFADASATMRWDWAHELRRKSPEPIPATYGEQWRLILRSLFDPSDRIFSGAPFDSGKPHHARHFLTVAELLELDCPYGVTDGAPDWRITCATFPEGCFERKAAKVERRLLHLIECDALIGREPRTWEEREANKMACLALFRWLRAKLGIRFAAIIDTGSKSLHGWARLTDDEREMLIGYLGEVIPPFPIEGAPKSYPMLDAGVLKNPAMIFRLPGTVHSKTGQTANLLFLNPNA